MCLVCASLQTCSDLIQHHSALHASETTVGKLIKHLTSTRTIPDIKWSLRGFCKNGWVITRLAKVSFKKKKKHKRQLLKDVLRQAESAGVENCILIQNQATIQTRLATTPRKWWISEKHLHFQTYFIPNAVNQPWRVWCLRFFSFALEL